MSKTYQTKRARASGPKQLAVPAEVTIALGEIASSAREGRGCGSSRPALDRKGTPKDAAQCAQRAPPDDGLPEVSLGQRTMPAGAGKGIGMSLDMNRSFSDSARVGWENIPSRSAV